VIGCLLVSGGWVAPRVSRRRGRARAYRKGRTSRARGDDEVQVRESTSARVRGRPRADARAPGCARQLAQRAGLGWPIDLRGSLAPGEGMPGGRAGMLPPTSIHSRRTYGRACTYVEAGTTDVRGCLDLRPATSRGPPGVPRPT